MTRLPIIDFKTMEKVLLHLGFQAVRQKGSHVFYRHSKTMTPSQDASVLDRRMAIEEQSRDTKGPRYGFKTAWNQFKQAERICRLFAFVGIVIAVHTALGREITKFDLTAALPDKTIMSEAVIPNHRSAGN